MKKIISTVKKSVIPSESIIISKKQIADLAFELIKKEIDKFPEIVGIEFGGSYAKGTWLSKGADVDIFIKFKKLTSEKKFEEISKIIGYTALRKFKPYVRYSEHPYVEAKIKKTKINVVPCYDVKLGDWKSSADRSTFHTKYMQKKLNSKMKNEVRLLKIFLKSVNIYGAEIANQGFSGYVAEVLILNYGTFENVIKSISKIKENHVIGRPTKKFDTTIVIIDPIDSKRNLAAAISDKNIGKFVLACRSFQIKPNLQFFNISKRKKSGNNWENVIVIKFNFRNRSPDIIWGQIKRTTSALTKQLEIGGFQVLNSMCYTDEKEEAYLFFLLDSLNIPKKYVKKGPKFVMEDGCNSFIKKNILKTELMWINNDSRIVSLEKRKHDNAIKYIKEFLKSSKEKGIPKGLEDDFKRGFDIFVGNKKLRKSIKEATLDLFSTNEKLFYSR